MNLKLTHINKEYNVKLIYGDFSVIRLRQRDNALVVYTCVVDEIQWPLPKNETVVKVNDSQYFFLFRESNYIIFFSL